MSIKYSNLPATKLMDLDYELEYIASEYDQLASELLRDISNANIYRLPVRYPPSANSASSRASRAKYPATITQSYIDNLHIMYRYYHNLAGMLYSIAHRRLPCHASDYASLTELLAELPTTLYYYA